MRVYATPNGKTGPLYKTGNSTVKIVNPWKQ